MADEEPREEVPRPDMDAMARSDWAGAEAVAVMLADLEFPATVKALRARAGNWRVPVRGSEETVPLERLLADLPDGKRFGSASDVARAVAREFKGF